MTFARIAACAILLAVAAGCASPSYSPSALGAAPFTDPAHGVVLVSTGAAERCIGAAMWAPIYDARTESPAPGRPLLPIDANPVSDFADHYGTLNALSLPPGRYLITAEWSNPVSEPTSQAPAWSFDVVAGQTTYIGEIWRATPCQLNAVVQLRDNFERDLALAEKLNKAFIAHPPAKAMAATLHDGLVGRQARKSVQDVTPVHKQ